MSYFCAVEWGQCPGAFPGSGVVVEGVLLFVVLGIGVRWHWVAVKTSLSSVLAAGGCDWELSAVGEVTDSTGAVLNVITVCILVWGSVASSGVLLARICSKVERILRSWTWLISTRLRY